MKLSMMAVFSEKIVQGIVQPDRTGQERVLQRKSVCFTPVMTLVSHRHCHLMKSLPLFIGFGRQLLQENIKVVMQKMQFQCHRHVDGFKMF